jgi:hypothetical protein
VRRCAERRAQDSNNHRRDQRGLLDFFALFHNSPLEMSPVGAAM